MLFFPFNGAGQADKHSKLIPSVSLARTVCKRASDVAYLYQKHHLSVCSLVTACCEECYYPEKNPIFTYVASCAIPKAPVCATSDDGTRTVIPAPERKEDRRGLGSINNIFMTVQHFEIINNGSLFVGILRDRMLDEISLSQGRSPSLYGFTSTTYLLYIKQPLKRATRRGLANFLS